MSSTVITGKEEPNSLPVFGFVEFGPVDPLQPPITLLHITKYLSVSIDFPGPTIISHHPGKSCLSCLATCESPLIAWQTKIALLFSLFNSP